MTRMGGRKYLTVLDQLVHCECERSTSSRQSSSLLLRANNTSVSGLVLRKVLSPGRDKNAAEALYRRSPASSETTRPS